LRSFALVITEIRHLGLNWERFPFWGTYFSEKTSKTTVVTRYVQVPQFAQITAYIPDLTTLSRTGGLIF